MVNDPLTNDRCCPICGGANECRIANGCLYKGPCWCEAASIPPAVVRHLAEIQLEAACLCHRCVVAIAAHAVSLDTPSDVLSRVRADTCLPHLVQAGDSYLDEHGQIVFTAAYHLKRGYCCGNGCRHCPFANSVPVA